MILMKKTMEALAKIMEIWKILQDLGVVEK